MPQTPGPERVEFSGSLLPGEDSVPGPHLLCRVRAGTFDGAGAPGWWVLPLDGAPAPVFLSYFISSSASSSSFPTADWHSLFTCISPLAAAGTIL